MEPQTVMSGDRTEDTFTKQVEDYTATIPSSAYLGVAISAMALPLALEVGGRGKMGKLHRAVGPDVANNRAIQQGC